MSRIPKPRSLPRGNLSSPRTGAARSSGIVRGVAVQFPDLTGISLTSASDQVRPHPRETGYLMSPKPQITRGEKSLYERCSSRGKRLLSNPTLFPCLSLLSPPFARVCWSRILPARHRRSPFWCNSHSPDAGPARTESQLLAVRAFSFLQAES